LNLVALANFMRLSSLKGAPWPCQVLRGRKSGFARDDKGGSGASIEIGLLNKGPFYWVCGSPKVMKNTFYPAVALHGSIALPFVIPSAAEGSAVLRPNPGNVFRQLDSGPFVALNSVREM